MDFYPSIILQKMLVLNYSGLQLVETQSKLYKKKFIFKCQHMQDETQTFRRKKTTTKKISLPLYGCLRKVYSISEQN